MNKDKIAAFNYETLGNAAFDHSKFGKGGEHRSLEHTKRDLVLEYSNKKSPSFKRSSPSNAMSMDELEGRVRIIVDNANSHNKAVLKGRLAPWVIGGGVAAAGTVAATKAIKKKKKDKKK